MKKILALLLCLILCFCFTACGENTKDDNKTTIGENSDNPQNDKDLNDTAKLPDQPLSDWKKGEHVEFRILNCVFTEKFQTVNPDYHNAWWSPEKGNTYVYILIEAKNLSQEYPFTLEYDYNAELNFEYKGKNHFMQLWLEGDEGMLGNPILDEGATGMLHFYRQVELEAKTGEVVVKGHIDGVEFEQKILNGNQAPSILSK